MMSGKTRRKPTCQVNITLISSMFAANDDAVDCASMAVAVLNMHKEKKVQILGSATVAQTRPA